MKQMISAEEAINIIIDHTKILGKEKIFITEALGRVLAQDIYSPYNIPFADNSAMDGYVLKAMDTKGASENNPAKLKLIGTIPAGKIFHGKINSGEACKIMTGGIIPEGADCVARKEICKEENGFVYIYKELKPEKDLRKAGEDIKEGELVLEKGTEITPAVVGVLASIGKSVVYVYKKPKISILISGDEIADIDEPLIKGKVKNSNTYSLIALIKEFGGIPVNCGIIKDNKENLKNAIIENLNSDIILSTGGVSVGDYDFTKEVIKEVGFNIHFWRLKIKPGKPLLFATYNDKLYFGIPGNPVSTMVVFYQFIMPAILKMQGFNNIFLPKREAILIEEINKKDSRREYIRGILFKKNGKLYVKTTGPQGSGILKSMVKGNCLIEIQEDQLKLEKGSKVIVYIYGRIKF